MARKKAQEDTRPTRLPKESEEYVSKRDKLRLAEIDSVKSRERVAVLVVAGFDQLMPIDEDEGDSTGISCGKRRSMRSVASLAASGTRTLR
jgi:hypothetical protein